MTTIQTDDLIASIDEIFSSSPMYSNIPIQGIQQLISQEGLKNNAYQDEFGNWTIGVGHTPSHKGEVWTTQQCISQLFSDVNDRAIIPLSQQLPWTSTLGTIRWWVNVNISFNMGIDNWVQFHEALNAMQNQDWEQAVAGMKNSIWYKQVPNRVNALAYQLYFNKWVGGYLTEAQQIQLDNI